MKPICCVICKESDPARFYYQQTTRCKKCHVEYTTLRRFAMKRGLPLPKYSPNPNPRPPARTMADAIREREERKLLKEFIR